MVTIGKNASISQLPRSSRGLKYSHRHNRTLTGSRYEPKTPPVMVEYREHKKPLRKPLRASEQKEHRKTAPGRAVFVFSGALGGCLRCFPDLGGLRYKESPRVSSGGGVSILCKTFFNKVRDIIRGVIVCKLCGIC